MGVERYSIIVIVIFVLTGAGLLYLMRATYQEQIADLRDQLELSRAREAQLAKLLERRSVEAVRTKAQALYEQARRLEVEGKGAEAVRVYIRAARARLGKAALRLGEIYDKGIPGVARDPAESLKWYKAARALGEPVPLKGPSGASS